MVSLVPLLSAQAALLSPTAQCWGHPLQQAPSMWQLRFLLRLMQMQGPQDNGESDSDGDDDNSNGGGSDTEVGRLLRLPA